MPSKVERRLLETPPRFQWSCKCGCGEQLEIRADRPVVIQELAGMWGRKHRDCDRWPAKELNEASDPAPCWLPGAHGQRVCVRELGSKPCDDCVNVSGRAGAPYITDGSKP